MLEDAGLQILVRNYLCKMGELDIVALAGVTGAASAANASAASEPATGASAGAILVIVEVRLRATEDFGGAAASITYAKQQRIVRATRHLLAARPQLQKLPIRFDVVLVPSGHGAPEWLHAAFDA